MLQDQKLRDTIPINSIEEQPQPPPRLTGVTHYVSMLRAAGLDKLDTLDHTDANPPDTTPSATPPHSPVHKPRTFTPPITIPAPSPPTPPSNYSSRIYTGTTHDPAIFLSILHIAQHNRTDLNLLSALNHIPNLPPSDPVPVLHPAAQGNLAPQPFLENGCVRPKRNDDEDVTVAFLPDFYDQGERHALGFYRILHCQVRGRLLGCAFFTPCSEEELRRYGLVEYMDPQEGFGEGGVETMRRVGCKKGVWLERDTVEEYEDWKLVLRIASVTWEARMQLIKGGTEG